MASAPYWFPYPAINDPARPVWHFGAPAGWLNDPHGVIWHDGFYHVFYQHNPGSDERGDFHWGHARSRDLVHWEHLPLALRPQHEHGEKHCYSGCLALTADGEPRILYTSVPHDSTRAATQVLAHPVDRDWFVWKQHPATPFLDLARHDGPAFDGDWRDPYVFRAAGRTFLVIGAREGDESVIALYENPDGQLEQWRYRGTLLRAPESHTHFFECPSLVPFGERWLLLYSPCREVEWRVGALDFATGTFTTHSHGRIDDSDSFYATQTLAAPDGRRILFGWAQRFPVKRGWAGCLGVPRHLSLTDAGELRQSPVHEIEQLRGAVTEFPAQPLPSSPVELALPGDPCADAEFILQREPGAHVALSIAGVRVHFDDDGVRFNERPLVALAAPERLHVRCLLDRSLVELFVNDHAAYTRVVPHTSSASLHLSALAGSARLVRACAWPLRAAPAVSLRPVAQAAVLSA